VVLAAYDRLFGLELGHLAVDGCIIKAPCGGEVAGRSPVDRGKQGLKRSILRKQAASRWARPLPRPTAATMGCWPPPSPWSARCRPSQWCTWTPAMIIGAAERC
jgi:hypothetical protein